MRDELIRELAQYKNYNLCDLIVVFDAKQGTNFQNGRQIVDSIAVIYAKGGQTADAIVEKIVHTNEKYDRIYVVTSDYMQQKVIFKKNIYRKSIREFSIELKDFKQNLTNKLKKNKYSSEKSFYSVENRIDQKTRKSLNEIRKGKDNKI